MRSANHQLVKVRLSGQPKKLGSLPPRQHRSRGQVLCRASQWRRALPHVRRSAAESLNQSKSQPVTQSRRLKSTINAQPQALLKAWRCLSAALFAGALASPVVADMQMPVFGQEKVSVQVRGTSGGGGSANKYYLGLGAGLSRLEPEGETNGFSVSDTDSAGGKVFFGKYFSPQWRWEIGYTDAGVAGMSNPAAAADDNPEISYKIPSIAIDYLLREPSAKLNFYLRGGAALIQNDSEDTRIEFEDESETVGLLGVGMQWRLGDRMEARLALEGYGNNAAFASLSLASRLGRSQSRPTIADPVIAVDPSHTEQAITAAEPQPLPNITTVIEKPAQPSTSENAHAKLCKSVDRELNGVGFESGSAALTAQTKQQLDRVATALKRGPNIRVTVRGYTDSSGNSYKNQLLSQKRAQAVASYLMMAVGNFNNAPRAIGMGESNPIASNETAAGRARNRRIELNLKAGSGCDDAAHNVEIDDSTRLAAEHIRQPQSAAMLASDQAVVPAAGLTASYQSERSCQVINQVVKGLYFESGKYTLDSMGKRALMPVLAALRNDNSLRLQIKGHTDSVGQRSANKLLSSLRAKSVADYLMDQAPDTLVPPVVVGEGEMSPIASNASADGRLRNRRIEIALTGGRNCHLPVERTADMFAPAAPSAKKIAKLSQPDNNKADVEITPQADQPLVAQALTSVTPDAEPSISEQADAKLAELEADTQQVKAQATQQASAIAEAARPEAEQPENNLAGLEAVTAPVAEEVEPKTLAELSVPMVSPVAEPALSDTIDSNGEETPVVAALECTGIDRVVSGVQFAQGDIKLNQQSRKVLDPVVALLRRDPGINVIVEGHTDDTGGARENMQLSEKRAKAVAAYLAGGAGMVKNPPLALGFGETKPLHANTTAAGRKANRRIVLKLNGGQGCLSNDMLAGIPGLQEVELPEPATLQVAEVSPVAMTETDTAAAPASAALTQQLLAMSSEERQDMFVAAVGRMSRGHGACGVQSQVVEAIDFAPGDHRLDIEDQRALMPLVTLWREMPTLNIEVQGYTDDVGSAGGNRRLSQLRADAVAQFLMFETGLAENPPTAKGYGESNPRASNATAAGRQLNRRIEVLVSGGVNCAAAKPELAEVAPVEEVADEVIELVQVAAIDLPLPEQELLHSVSGGGSAGVQEPAAVCESELLHTNVNFDTGAFFLNDHSRAALSSVLDVLRADPSRQVEVQGHTDNVGSAKRNLSLSERRADAVAQYLMHATGSVDNPPIAVGYGADMPIGDNNSDTGRAQNRRIDILLSGGQNCQQDNSIADQLIEAELNEAEQGNVWALPKRQVAQLGHGGTEAEQCVAVQRVVEGLTFEPAGYRLGARAKNALAPVLEVLRDDPSLMVEVYGYSADYGDVNFDYGLAERRAEAVADYLMIKSGNFDNLPVAVGFGDLGEGMTAEPSSPLYRANRIELRLSKGASCELPVTGGISIRRPGHSVDSAQAPAAAALMQSQGGGANPAQASLLSDVSCEVQNRVLDGVSFAAGDYELDRASKLALQQVAQALQAQPELSYEVHGHTDAKGDESANLALSQWRASTVADYLARQTGAWPTVANAEGYGETRPLASNDTESGRAVNRRIELQLHNSNCQ